MQEREKKPRPRLTVAQCLEKLSETAPALAVHATVDRSWVWICTKVRKSEYGDDTPKKLYELGFRATKKPGGHPIEGTDRVGYWGNACQKPTPFFRGGKSNANDGVTTTDQPEETQHDPDVDQLYSLINNL
jgi:hypothetical protein